MAHLRSFVETQVALVSWFAELEEEKRRVKEFDIDIGTLIIVGGESRCCCYCSSRWVMYV